ncbi:MAG: hypothetical protein JST00_42915 [Deltaproteobacteria bacterium]|nr:hypothetical protein [Deltaproteobacteria bacterium]
MSRADLLALTPEAIATLANVGLVKRAQKEIAAGTGPSLVEEADGTVVGTFADGVVARLVPGKTLRETPCSCNSSTTCRHRVAVALAYRTWHGSTPAAASFAGWSPAEIDDAALEVTLGPRPFARAKAILSGGLLATVQRASDGAPSVTLPSCTVRFLVPRDVSYARCDCAEQGACEHLALAVWAFREAGSTDGVVALGGKARVDVELAAVDDLRAIARELVGTGIAGSAIGAARFARVRTRAEKAGMVWMASLTSDLERMLESYASRSALYSNAEARRLVLEIEARARAARSDGAELPARYVLGEDEAPETLLDHVRLVSLGARIRADGDVRLAEIYLADPDTSTVLVLGKRWDACKDPGHALAHKSVGGRISLGQLATGQLVSKAVKRRANRSVEVGTSRANQSSVTPQHGAWGSLGAPILVRDVAAHLSSRVPPSTDPHEAQRARTPWMLRPRLLAESMHVVAVSAVRDVGYSASEQAVVAVLADEAGGALRAVLPHRAVTPHALDAASAALSKSVRFVSGDLSRDASGLVLEILAIAGETLVVPDLAGPTAAPPLDRTIARASGDGASAAEARANGVLEELLVSGLGGAASTVIDRARASATALRDAGLGSAADRMARLAEAAKARDREAGARAWLDAAVWLALVAELA